MNHTFTFKEESKPKKHLDKYINNCNVTNIKKLSEELKKYCKEPLFIEKYKNSLKELIQILFKYLFIFWSFFVYSMPKWLYKCK